MEDNKHRSFLKGFGAGVGTGIVGAVVLTILALFVYSMITGQSFSVAAINKDVLDNDTISKVNELTSYIDKYYYEDVDDEELQDSLLHGLVEGLGDKYSVYYDDEEYKQLQISTSGTFSGIGAGLKQNSETKKVSISKVYDDTPAQEAGLLVDDVLVTVDGTDISGKELNDIVNLIRGEEGTTVTLEIYRESEDTTFSVDVTRRTVEIPSVEGEMLDNGIAYIQISEFQTHTAEQFEEILENLKSQEMNGLIIDVRANPGGLVSVVTEIAQSILPTETVGDTPAGTIVYTKDKSGDIKTYGEDDGQQVDCPIVLLVDSNSASASEILAGAIKDYSQDGFIDATLVGTTTYGKGIVQTIFNLSDDDAVKITTASYYTPNGNNIHGTGIEPNVELEYEYTGDTNGDYDKAYDNQLQKAIEILTD